MIRKRFKPATAATLFFSQKTLSGRNPSEKRDEKDDNFERKTMSADSDCFNFDLRNASSAAARSFPKPLFLKKKQGFHPAKKTSDFDLRFPRSASTSPLCKNQPDKSAKKQHQLHILLL